MNFFTQAKPLREDPPNPRPHSESRPRPPGDTPPREVLTEAALKKRVQSCPRLSSLRSIDSALREALNAEHSFTGDIADIIRRDPSLTTRLLRTINSAFFGLAERVERVEEAVFYLGLREVRNLSLATPIIEDLGQIFGSLRSVDWKAMWRHALGTAVLTRSLMEQRHPEQSDDPYIAGLLHDIGKIVMAHAFPEDFGKLCALRAPDSHELCLMERRLVVWDHPRIGASYLEHHHMSKPVVSAVLFHHQPGTAPEASRELAAAVQVADQMMHSLGFPGIENTEILGGDQWHQLEGWRILFPENAHEGAILPRPVQQQTDRLLALLQSSF